MSSGSAAGHEEAVYNMAVWPKGPARLRRAWNLLGYCLGCPLHLVLGLGLGAIGLVLLGVGGGVVVLSSASAGGWAGVWTAQPTSGCWESPGLLASSLGAYNGGHSEGHLLRRKSQVIVRTVFLVTREASDNNS